MAIFYPPPQPLFPRPQAVITQVTPAGAFTASQVAQSTAIEGGTWVPPYQAPQRLTPAPVFPAPATPDLGFLLPPRGPAVQSQWTTPVSITLFTGSAPPQGDVSTPPPPLPRNPAFDNYIRTPDVPVRSIRPPVLPFVPPFPDFGYIISLALRAVPSVDAAYRVIANTPIPPRLPQTQPTTGMAASLVLPSPTSPQSGQSQAIQLVWLVPPIKAIRPIPVPNFPVPPPPPPGAFAYDHFMIGISIGF